MKRLTKNKKLFAVVIALVVGVIAGGAYMTLLKKSPSGPVPVNTVGLGDVFYFSLADEGHFAKATIAIETPDVLPTVAPNANSSAAGGPNWLTGQDYALARDAVTSTVSSYTSSELLNDSGMASLKAELAKSIGKALKIKVTRVLLTDFIVQ